MTKRTMVGIAPVGSGLIEAMAQTGFSPAWPHEYEFPDFALTLGRDQQGAPALFLYDAIGGEVVGPFRPRPA